MSVSGVGAASCIAVFAAQVGIAAICSKVFGDRRVPPATTGPPELVVETVPVGAPFTRLLLAVAFLVGVLVGVGLGALYAAFKGWLPSAAAKPVEVQVAERQLAPYRRQPGDSSDSDLD